ncbi:hypothetical protein ABT354_17975 [Streptomyces sp. NPDC000594]|uniref:hypothetical protein n=1 Tax=Streptomyces sp. NPDC000594 TaxID=3154261 RepID=UPI003327794D
MHSADTDQRTTERMSPTPTALLRPVAPDRLRAAVQEFLGAPASGAAVPDTPTAAPRGPVPVLVDGRPDLAESIDLASPLYDRTARPTPLDHGVVLGAGELVDGTTDLAAPLARSWLSPKDLHRWGHELGGTLLILGTYRHLRLDPVRALLQSTYRADGLGVSFLSGRDPRSLHWHVAKQYLATDGSLTRLGLFTDTDRPAPAHDVRVYDDRAFERVDIRSEILDHRWRKVVFQGHGKDDSVNLGEFTLCGLNPTAPRDPALLGPRCAYGLPCYKPEDKLVPLHRVAAAEIVLSACNSGPLSDLALYDPRYQILLNALDGPARTVVSAVSVHDSDRPENTEWMRAAATGADSADTLNASLAGSHPYPAFMRFGLPHQKDGAPPPPPPADHRPDELLLTVGTRLTALLTGDLLPHNHPLRPRLTRLARKTDLWVARPTYRAERSGDRIRASLTADLQSLDHAIARQVTENPETELMNYPAHFGDRSRLDPRVDQVVCHCGRPAQRFTRRGLLPHVLDTVCVVCLRCGDVTFRVPGAPGLLAYADDTVPAGGVLEIRAELTAARPGPVRLGVFVPGYLREDTAVTPAAVRVKAADRTPRDVTFQLRFAPDTAPQAYYFTVFAVQDLAVSTARRHFGVVPRTG